MLSSKPFHVISPLVAIVLLLAAPLLMSGNPIFVNDNAYAQQTQGDPRPTYFIYIHPPTFEPDPSHYSVSNAAVPAGTTVAWVNNDLAVEHTVTSGNPDDPNSGAAFDSGEMPSGARFLRTFTSENGLVGDFTYYCTLHPWMTAQISSDDRVVQGNSFQFRSGTGPTLNLAENNRVLLAFTPIDLSVIELSEQRETPMNYDFEIIRNSDGQTVYSEDFAVENNDFEIELIQFANVSQISQRAENNTVAWGPDGTTRYTGAYHAAGDFFSQPGDYTLRVEMTGIGAQPPPQQMSDEFTFSVT